MSGRENKILKLLFLIPLMITVICEGQAIKNINKKADRVEITMADGNISIMPMTDNSVRIRFCKVSSDPLPELVFTEKLPVPDFNISDSPSKVELRCRNLIVSLDKQ